jgi:hypothetical protein
MKPLRIILLGAALASVASCSALRDYHAANPDFGSPSVPYERIQFAGSTPTADERAKCEAVGGRIEKVGRLGTEQCIQTYPDAGKTCSDSEDCLGECRIRDDLMDVKPGKPVEGVCQAEDTPFGCHAWVVRGVAGPTICVD